MEAAGDGRHAQPPRDLSKSSTACTESRNARTGATYRSRAGDLSAWTAPTSAAHNLQSDNGPNVHCEQPPSPPAILSTLAAFLGTAMKLREVYATRASSAATPQLRVSWQKEKGIGFASPAWPSLPPHTAQSTHSAEKQYLAYLFLAMSVKSQTQLPSFRSEYKQLLRILPPSSRPSTEISCWAEAAEGRYEF